MYDYISPWSEYSRKKLLQITKDRIVYTGNVQFTRNFGRKYPWLFDEKTGYMDIARIDKRRESVIVLRPNCGLAPIPGPPSMPKSLKFRPFKIF